MTSEARIHPCHFYLVALDRCQILICMYKSISSRNLSALFSPNLTLPLNSKLLNSVRLVFNRYKSAGVLTFKSTNDSIKLVPTPRMFNDDKYVIDQEFDKLPENIIELI